MSDRPRQKDLSELTLMDNYMFGAVMEDPKLIKPLIEVILGMKLVRIEFAEEQKAIKKRYAGKGIQLDLYVEDENGVIYNVEVQTTDKKNLPKRMRYYQAIIDLHILSPGANYNALRKSYVIFICNYDPFGKDRIVYRYENRCMEEPELSFGDEMIKVVINTKGTKGEVSDELRELIRYLNDQIVTGTFTRELDNAVNSVKANEERRHEYMVWYAHEMELREEGREEGRKKA